MSPRKKAEVADLSPPITETAEGAAAVVVADVGAALYRDKAGSPRTKQMTEGQANFAAVKTLAEEAVASAQASAEIDREEV